jgi:CDGSH-type Zn-finger protein
MRNMNFMSRILLSLLLFVAFENVKAQRVVVNPDGTHSIVIDNGSTKTIVNPNGTHSTVIDNGSTKIIVNPNGTHSTVIDNGSTKTMDKRQKKNKKNNR